MTIARRLPDDSLIRSVRDRLDRPLVLVGMMGAGKSTVGRKLAAALEMDFTDADDEIVEAAGMSIAEVFDRFGEEHFRDGERRVIARLMENAGSGQVIATGGGAFLQDETRALILDMAIAIWLDAAIDTLVERVSRNDRRPLLRTGDIPAKVTAMKEERSPIYSKAPIHIQSDTGPHNVAVTRIIEALDRWL
ncbi:shikimate kinase [Aurantiacibacter aquimixticola]|uniref:Shikimate kinase n=1 Tax=Aurantiacibacter aquimixticola TaxID=1958945 RepID=A0A419RS97_9SPHN|nr:shikimate kinase [Aurantiacibacter aquimixticola]RJY08657.1 shikimate kinase [Aurantiacibacter aquimixticola]